MENNTKKSENLYGNYLNGYIMGNNFEPMFPIIWMLKKEDYLNDKEIECFYYALDVIEKEYNEYDYGKIALKQADHYKNLINQNKFNALIKIYSRAISSAPSIYIGLAGAGVAGTVVSSFLTGGLLMSVPLLASINQYSKYNSERKFGEESLVKEWQKLNNQNNFIFLPSNSMSRMDSFKRKITYFSETTERRLHEFDDNQEGRNKLFQGIKFFLIKFIKESFDFINATYKGRGINPKIRTAEKKLYDTFGNIGDVKKTFNTINNEIYNEYLSQNIEQYLKHLASERYNIKKELNLLNKKSKQADTTEAITICKKIAALNQELSNNTKQIKKIANIEGINYISSPMEAIYYAGASRLANNLLNDDNIKSRSYTAIIGKSYHNLINLEKRKSLFHSMLEDLRHNLHIDYNDSDDVFLFNKCAAIILAGDNPADTKFRIHGLLSQNIQSAGEVEWEQEIYSQFIDQYHQKLNTYTVRKMEDEIDIDNSFKDKLADIIEEKKGKKARRIKMTNK